MFVFQGVDDSGGDSTNLSVDNQLSTSENRLRRMNQMLKVTIIIELLASFVGCLCGPGQLAKLSPCCL